MQLRRHIVYTLLIFLSIPLAAVGWLVNHNVVEEREEEFRAALRHPLEETSLAFASQLQTIRANLNLFSQSSLLENYLKVADEGVRYNVMQLPLLNLFASYARAYPDYYEFRVLYPDGYEDTRYVSGEAANRTEEEGGTPFFRAMAVAGAGFFFTVMDNPDNGEVALLAAQRLATPAGEHGPGPAWLVVTIRPSLLLQRAAWVRIGQTGFLFFTDGAGRVLHSPGRAPAALAMGRAVPGLVAVARGSGIDTLDLDGQEFDVAGMALDDALLLFAARESREPFAVLRATSLTAITLILLAVLFSFGMMYLILRRLFIQPIAQLAEAAHRIGQGRYDIALQDSGVDEFDRLLATFNRMAADLRTSHERIAEHSRTLEQRVAARTDELSQANQTLAAKLAELEETRERLLLASQEAERANRAKSVFLANMSHEIRSPMNGVLGMLELLTESGLSQEQGRMATVASHAAEGLLAIIDDILDFSKVEAGRVELEEVAFDLMTVLDGVLAMAAVRAGEKGIELAARVAEPLPMRLLGDPTRLQQVLANLVSNGVKFTEAGEVELTVRVAAGAEGDGAVTLEFAVWDTGIGIPAAAQATLFQPFQQADSGITRRYGGTGLGLAIAARLAGLMGDGLTVASSSGQGSCFTFGARLRDAGSPWWRQSGALRGKRALLLCRHGASQRVLSRMLAGWEMVITCAEGVDEAVTRLAAGRSAWDVVLVALAPPRAARDALVTAFPGVADKVLIVAPLDVMQDLDELAVVNKPVASCHLGSALAALLQGRSSGGEGDAQGRFRHGRFHGAVLLVEDTPINQEVAREMLRRLGVACDVAGDGREALAMTAARDYDLVLMDMQMPGMDGLEAARRLRAREGARRLPIVAMTANAMSQDRQACLEAGMDDFLAKPVRLAGLAQKLSRWLAPAPEAPTGEETVTTEGVVLDEGLLAELALVLGTEFFATVEHFLLDTQERMTILREGVEQGGAAQVKSRAHQLKGIGASFGAMEFSRLCGCLQHLGEKGRWDQARALMPTIEAALTRVTELLRTRTRHDR